MRFETILNLLTMGALKGEEAHRAAIAHVLAPPKPRRGDEKKPGPRRAVSHQRHFGGKHYGGSHAPECPACRVTLSRGECLNRMCSEFVG